MLVFPFVLVEAVVWFHGNARSIINNIIITLIDNVIQGCILSAPSSRMTSPFIIGFSMSACTRWAYSSGSPRRWGKGMERASSWRTASGRLARRGVSNKPMILFGCMVCREKEVELIINDGVFCRGDTTIGRLENSYYGYKLTLKTGRWLLFECSH